MVAIVNSNGPHFVDPREFLRFNAISAQTVAFNASVGSLAATAATFFTEMARRGLNDDTNWTANTYKTILSVTGMGMVANVIGPTGLAGTPTTTVEVTVDGGAAIAVALVQTTTAHRSILGPAFMDNTSTGAFYTGAGIPLVGPNALNAGKDTIVQTSMNHYVSPWETLRLMGTPCLIFRRSLLIRMKTSENNSTTTNQERQSAVQYMVMG